MLQQMNGIVLPQLDTDWYQIDRQDVHGHKEEPYSGRLLERREEEEF